jgi:parallel beta-helix repeat protein
MMKTSVTAILAGMTLTSSLWAAEKWVDQSAAPGGTGSSNAPFQTISAAITAAAIGDTVTVRNGTYRERVNLKSGLPGQPFTLQSAPGSAGTNVVISGFRTVAGWQPYSGEVYTTTVNMQVRDLYVGYAPQRLSRYPDSTQPWCQMSSFDETKTIITTTNMPLPSIIGMNSFIFGIESTSSRESHLPISAVNPAGNTVTLSDANAYFKTNDWFLICNDPALISQPGEWAYVSNGITTTLYFWPQQTSDLSRTQSSDASVSGPVYIDKCTNVLVRGVEITGNARSGIGAVNISGSRYVTIENCVVHDNRVTGISARGCANITVSRCVVVRADHGIIFSGVHKGLIEECEVAFNYGDGINVIGDPSQTVPEFRYADQVVVRRNYIHHHLYLEHPDNVQIYSGVKRFRFEDNVCLFGGQAMMSQECDTDLAMIGNVFFGHAASIFQGHTDSWNWALWGNLFGFAGWSHASMPGQDFRFYENIVYGGGHSTGLQYQGDRNVIWLDGSSDKAVTVTSNGIYKAGYSTLAAYVAASTQDVHSVQADPKLVNVPISQGYMSRPLQGTVSNQFISTTPSGNVLLTLATNDLIEVNGDGVARTVTQIKTNSVYFTPALPALPFRDGYGVVWQWGTNTNRQLDTRPGLTGSAAGLSSRGGPAGSSLVVSNFQAGNFNGDGIRELPPIPATLQADWPDPNDMKLPYLSPL